MKKRFFTLLLAVAASVGTLFAEPVLIGDLYYNLDATNQTAEVTSSYGKYSGDIVIPDSVTYNTKTYTVTSIGEYAFYQCPDVTSVTIPNSVTSISGTWSFAKSVNLTSVTIGNGVTSIGPGAFDYCIGLTSVHISDLAAWCAISFENSSSNPLCYAHNLYINGVLITDLVIPSSVTSIGNYAFYNCTCLTSVTIPNGMTTIGDNILYGCYALKTVSAPAGVFDVSESDWTYHPKYLQSVTLNGGEINDNVIGVLRRSYKTLTLVDISAVNNEMLSDEAFKDFYNLQNLVLPQNLTKIGYMAVAECVKLQEINIPASVTEIEDRAFEDCRSLQTITFEGSAPSSVSGKRFTAATSGSQLRKIGNWAFYNAHQLQNLVLPEGVEEIGDAAFYGCTYLENLTLPSSVQSIGDNCFALCSKLQDITVEASTPPTIQAKTFFDVKRSIPVYVPAGSETNYTNDMYWSEFNIRTQGTDIKEVLANPSAPKDGKVLHDGHLYILRNGQAYDMTGRKL